MHGRLPPLTLLLRALLVAAPAPVFAGATQGNAPAARQHHIAFAPGVGNPLFENEKTHERATFPDAGLRLLALYRYRPSRSRWSRAAPLLRQRRDPDRLRAGRDEVLEAALHALLGQGTSADEIRRIVGAARGTAR